MAWHRKLTEKAFFVIVFVLVSTVGIASLLGVSGNDILETMINAAIATAVSILLTFMVFWSERKSATRG